MAKKLFIQTHGCQMNEYDSSRMADLLGDHQAMELTDNPDEADVILLNTCSIREKAQEKVFSELGRWRPLKEKNPELIIGVGGCVASQEGSAIRDRASYVDVVFGPQTLHRLPEMIDAARTTHQPQVDVSFPEIEKFDALPEPRVDGPTAFVSIMEGCSKYCSFCVVPYTRGEEVSRPLADVLSEILHLAENGVKEVTLLGQNVNGYRFDGTDFADLLHAVAAIDGIERIRYTTSHPLEFSDAIIQAHAARHGRRSHRRPWRGAAADALFTPAGAIGLRPRAGSDEAQPHRAGVQVAHPQAESSRAGHHPKLRLHHRLPGRNRP